MVTLAIVDAVQALAADALGPEAATAAAAAAATSGGRSDGGGRDGVGLCPLDIRIKWPNDVYGTGLKARRAAAALDAPGSRQLKPGLNLSYISVGCVFRELSAAARL